MTIHTLSTYFQKLEQTTSRNEMVVILAELFSNASPSDIGKIVYLTQGRVAPLYEAVEFGLADKMVMRAMAQAFVVKPKEVQTAFRKTGDLGIAAEKIKGDMGDKGKKRELAIGEIYEKLRDIASSGGQGSQEQKITLLADLLKELDPLSVRYITRIPIGKLRLGFSDMTVLDALSWMLSGTKEHRKEIERAYNVRPDLSFIASQIKEKGIKGLAHVQPKVGVPILMARAERLSSGEEIIKKIGPCAVEFKIDGFRLQVHYRKRQTSPPSQGGERGGYFIKLFTRNLEDVTFMYPDVVEGIRHQIRADEAIFEGEAVAFNPLTKEFLPFQETVQRKRKYDIEETAIRIPLRLICFDVLYKDGENLLTQTYGHRRHKLERLVHVKSKDDTVLVSEMNEVETAKHLEQLFEEAATRGLEGVMAKRLEGVYQAGARGWNWIKYKRSYSGKLNDTIDAIVMGYDYGQGKRNTFGIGDFLIGIYDKPSDTFKTIAKIGTGLSDEEWRQMKKNCDAIKTKAKPARFDVDKMMACDVWVEPQLVVVIRADEITRSPVHTAGRTLKASKSGSALEVDIPGFALRFPRLEQFRSDKSPEDATSLKEIEEMHALQGKKKK